MIIFFYDNEFKCVIYFKLNQNDPINKTNNNNNFENNTDTFLSSMCSYVIKEIV